MPSVELSWLRLLELLSALYEVAIEEGLSSEAPAAMLAFVWSTVRL